MSVATYTKSGSKAATSVKLDKSIFGVEVTNHELIKQAYVAYLANGRENLAVTKTRGLVSGGGKKPWKQKGTGRARFGSSRVPIWRGGGITFGPTGLENYSKKLNIKAKRQAIRQALSLANTDGRINVVETFDCKNGSVRPTVELLKKIGASRRTLIVVSNKDDLVERATRNLTDVKAVQANYLNVYDIVNAHHIIISKKSLNIISEWLGENSPTPKSVADNKEAK
ncbi:50S ribosomal protein L4 [Candidatus Saccharibacteria bacterium]|nr:50S ribosomal protein L4 [Candidatus Saccharibacteria bacterium]